MKFIRVSILIPLRNEEKNITALTNSLLLLDYPKENLEILLCNDASQDHTGRLIDNFAAKHIHVHAFHLIDNEEDSLKGKTRVLNFLAKKASGDFLFFTDADISLPTTWVTGMLAGFDHEKVGVVTGITGMKPTHLKAAMQSMEWLTVLFMLYLLAKFKIKGTGMGNNMAVRKDAYWATGGYEKIPFSIVEDYALFIAILKQGYEFSQLFSKQVLAYTAPPERFFEQRHRWLSGAYQSKTTLLIPGLLQSSFIPLVLVIYLTNPALSYWLLAFYYVSTLTFALIWQWKLGLKEYWKYQFFLPIYLPMTWLLTQLYYFIKPKRVVWKNRSYEQS